MSTTTSTITVDDLVAEMNRLSGKFAHSTAESGIHFNDLKARMGIGAFTVRRLIKESIANGTMSCRMVPHRNIVGALQPIPMYFLTKPPDRKRKKK